MAEALSRSPAPSASGVTDAEVVDAEFAETR
jgi:hypothetical protein